MVTNHIRSISIKVRVYKLQVQLTANMKNPKRLNINNKVLLEHLSPHPYRVGNNTTPALNEVSLFGVGLHGLHWPLCRLRYHRLFSQPLRYSRLLLQFLLTSFKCLLHRLAGYQLTAQGNIN